MPGTTPPAIVVLIGMMGSGKTTVGRALAERTGWRYVDNDELVRAVTGREPEHIDAVDGETALHAAEVAALRRALSTPAPLIVGAAAGVVLDAVSVALLAEQSLVVYLRARAETLHERIGSGAGRRHEATDLDWLRARLTERDETYRRMASLTIGTDELDAETIAQRGIEASGLEIAG